MGGRVDGPELALYFTLQRTVVKNFVGIGLPEKEQLAKRMQKACGVGGTVTDGQIEIQGDKRTKVAHLTEAGFTPVFAGG